MKFTLAVFTLTVVVYLSCSDSHRQGNAELNESPNKSVIKNKPAGSYSDTLKIKSPAAVIFNPDSLQLEKIKAITEPAIFESTMHDCFYQVRNSRIVIMKHYTYVKIIETKKARYLLFEKQGGEKEYVDLNDINDPCGLFIFDGHHNPRLVDMTNIETELGFYFAK